MARLRNRQFFVQAPVLLVSHERFEHSVSELCVQYYSSFYQSSVYIVSTLEDTVFRIFCNLLINWCC